MKSTIARPNAEEMLNILSEQAPVGVCIIQDGRFCYFNSNFPIAIGYTADELTGKDPLELIVPEDREMVRKNEIKMLKGELISPYQFRVIHKDGSITWVMEAVRSVQYHGRLAILGNYMEVTERKQMEEALKESEQRYKELANSITDIFFATDEHLRYTYWNKASEILTGIRAEDAVGKSLREIFPDAPGTRNAEEVYRKVLKTQQPQTFVNEFDVGGKHYIFEISAYPSRGGISVFAKDITERRQVEEMLRRSEEKYRTILEEMGDGYFESDLAGNLTFVNEALSCMSGYSKEEIIGMNFRAFRPKKEAEAVFEAYNRVYKTGEPFRDLFTETIGKDGRRAFAETSAFPLRNDNGEIIGFRGIRRDITERKQADEKLRQSEEKYRTILEEMEDSYFEVDLGGHVTFVNSSVCRDLGYPMEELIGMSYKHFTAVEDIESVFRVFNEVYRTGVPNKGLPWRTVPKDGSQGFAETSIALLRNDKGEIVGFRGVGRDVTERKKAEEALRQSEERYRTILEKMEEGYYEVDMAGNFTFVSDAMSRMLGYSRDELIGMNYKTYIPKEDVKAVFEAYNRVYRMGEWLKGFPMVEVRKDGTRLLVEDSIFPMRNDKGEVIGFRGISRDVIQRKQAEEKLRQSEENYRTLFDNSVNGTIVLDAETIKVVMANQAALNMFGLSSVDEALEVDPFGFIVPEDKERYLEITQNSVFKQNSHQTYEIKAVTKDGREIWVNTTATTIMYKGKLAALISFADITEQKKQAEWLMLTDRLVSLGELAAGTAHELNNPLTSIIGFSQLLMEKEVPDDIREDLKLIYNEAQRAACVTKNLLTFARKHAPVKQRNQINNIIEDVLKLRVYEHKVNGIEVERQLDPDLPEIVADYFQMQQLFFNIITNAEYFMIKEHNKGTLTVTTKKQDNTVMISFADDGLGIPAGNLRRIFDPFFTTKEVGKGTGLGLSICHGIVTEHDGQIYASSQLGKGATIFVELPIDGRDHIGDML